MSIDEIIAGMSEAQKADLLAPEELCWHTETVLELIEKGLVDTDEHGDGYSMWLTERGEAVRARLEEQSND